MEILLKHEMVLFHQVGLMKLTLRMYFLLQFEILHILKMGLILTHRLILMELIFSDYHETLLREILVLVDLMCFM